MIKQSGIRFLFLVACVWLFSGCMHEPGLVEEPGGTLYLHVHSNVDSLEVGEYNTIKTVHGGRKISLSLAQVYLTNIALVRLDGSAFPVPGLILLVTPGEENYLIGNVPSGNYKSIRFHVGIDSVTNQKIPIAPADSILMDSSMWFWNPAQPNGYVFINLQGRIDTTQNGRGTEEQMQPFVYKIGTNPNCTEVELIDNQFTVFPKNEAYLHIVMNYMQLLNGIQLNKSDNLLITSPSENSGILAKTICQNIPNMFVTKEY